MNGFCKSCFRVTNKPVFLTNRKRDKCVRKVGGNKHQIEKHSILLYTKYETVYAIDEVFSVRTRNF